jgi:Predicted Zn-dependent protease (DUF2268)
MTIRFYLLDACDEIPARVRDAILGELERARARVTRLLPLDRVDVVIGPGYRVIPEYGLEAFTQSKGRIGISVDPSSPHLESAQRGVRLLGLLAHELHHIARERGPRYGLTLGEALVSEGLAQCFEEEVGAPTPFYAVYVAAEALRHLDQRAREQASTTEYDYNAWFFGRRGDPDWPRYAAYSLGYALVKDWLSRAGSTAAASATVPAAAIVEPWVSGKLPAQPSF